MIFEYTRGLLFVCCIFFLTVCGHKNQPDPIDPGNTDSCTSVLSSGNKITSLSQPSFSVSSDTSLPFGSKVYLLADSISNAGTFEISLDSGKVWKLSKCVTLLNSGEIWGRLRYNKILSPIAKATYSIYYQRVEIIGNSITGHGPAPELGWTGDWGMAASAAENDYVHIITRKLQKLNPLVEIKVIQAVDFEQSFWKYDFTKLKSYADFQPDLVIMRIAENTNLDYINSYENSYDQYITQLTSKTTAKVICTTSFWSSHEEVSNRIRNVAGKKGYIIADLKPYSTDKSYTAYKSFSNVAVGIHPSDKGMLAIADCISRYF